MLALVPNYPHFCQTDAPGSSPIVEEAIGTLIN